MLSGWEGGDRAIEEELGGKNRIGIFGMFLYDMVGLRSRCTNQHSVF